MNSFIPHNSKSKRNEEELRSLHEQVSAVNRARFDSMPNSEDFKASLKNQLLEKRQLQRTSMWTKMKESLSHIIPTQKTLVFGMVILLLFGLVTTLLLNRPGLLPNENIAELLIDKAYARDNFEIIPTSGDSLAIDDTTEFIIKTKTPLEKSVLQSHIQLSPHTSFSLTQISPNEFRLSPENRLAEKQVYTLEIDAAYTDTNNIKVERDFSFAFQVKNQFKLLSAIPGNQVSGVPLNSGIELTFSSENFSDYEKNFSIEPKVDGKFQVRGRTLTFIPKGLKASTLYTVTINKNITVKGSDPLDENIILRFETQAPDTERQASYWNIYGDKMEFSSVGTQAIPVASGLKDPNDFIIKVYKFRSFDAYKKNYMESAQIPYWAYETRNKFVVPSSDIVLARDFSLKAQSYKFDYQKYLVLPENLPYGAYWFEISSGKQTHEMFIEVTDLASYLSVTFDKTLFWSNSLKTKAPLSGTTLALASGKTFGTTASDGTLTFDSALLGISTLPTNDRVDRVSFHPNVYTPQILEIANGDDKALLKVDKSLSGFMDAQFSSDEYIVHLSSDRSLYLPSDTVKFWGYIVTKDRNPVRDALTIGIPNTNNYFYGRSLGNMGFLQSVTVTPDEKGFFRGEIKLDNLTPSGYNLVLNKGEVNLLNQYLEVNAYAKPNYDLSFKSDKQAVFAGEKINFSAKVNFFEGTPVPNYPLSYTYDEGENVGTFTTDKNGEANFSIVSKLRESNCDFLSDVQCSENIRGIQYQNVSLGSKNTEESPVSQSFNYTVYGGKVGGTLEFTLTDKNHALVSSTWKNLDLSVLNNEDYADDDKMFTSFAGGKKIEGVIFETHWEKQETGQYYDFITKTTEKTYTYNSITTSTARFRVETDSKGHFEYPVTMVPDRAYEVHLTVFDGFGGSLSQAASVYSSFYDDPNVSTYTWYSLRETAEKTNPDKITYGYKVGDNVELEFYKNSSILENTTGNILFTELRHGLKKHTVQKSPRYSFTFGEEDVPNIYIGAVYFDGSTYRETEEGNYRQNIRFDSREKNLKVEVKTDKTSYKPGESVHVQIQTLDKNGKGHAARVNLSVIDEAFLSLTAYDNGRGGKTHVVAASDPLFSLYRSQGDGVILQTYSHQSNLGVMGGAEGGGCFLAGTKIRLRNGETKNIEDIAIGDIVQTLKNETDNTPVYGRVLKTKNHIVSEYLILNHKIRVTPEHRILINGVWATAGDIVAGDLLRGEHGETVKVFDIERQHELVQVYNFEVEKYHTYLAEGIYVHNDKGGSPTRSEFPDIALYQWVETNDSGKGSVNFTIPDSITSWRLTAEALSSDMYAGVGDATIGVSLPVFGVLSLPKELLRGDKPSFSAFAYGSALRAGENVDFAVSGNPFSSTVKKQSKAFERSIIPAEKALSQSGKVKLEIQTDKGSDALEQSYRTVLSRIEAQAQIVHSVQNGPLDLGEAKSSDSAVELRFVDAGRGSLYSRIYPLTWYGGSRLDQKIGTVVAKDWFHDFFSAEELSTPADLSAYIGMGGFKLLPYASEDLELSAKASAILKNTNAFDKERMRSAFVGKLYDTAATEEELASALWGASALGEAVIPSIHTLAEKVKEPRSKIFLALAATELGDNEYARTLYEDILKNKEESDTLAHIVLTSDKNQTLENSALMAVVAARLQDPLADKFDRYVQNEIKENLYTMEELLYIKEKIDSLPRTSAKATLTVNGKSQKLDLTQGKSEIREVVPSNFEALSLSDIEGSVSVIINYERPPYEGDVRSDKLGLTRKYFVNGKEVNSFKEGEHVEVRLYPKIANDAPAGMYLIVDSLPSALKLTSPIDSFSPWYTPSCFGIYPIEAQGQTVKFMVSRDFQNFKKDSWGYDCPKKEYLSYFTRISSLGEFKKEGALIQSVESKDVKNFSTDLGTIISSQ